MNIAKISHLSSIGLWGKKQHSLLDVMKQIKYIQIDAIYTIARSQDIVAYTRAKNYNEKDIWKHVNQKRLFEDYAHAKCIIPFEYIDYYYSARLDRRDKATWWQTYLDKHPKWPSEVLNQIENKGPTGVSAIEVPKEFPHSTGWNSPKKRILDYLESRGYIFGYHDEKFKIRYDLPERIYNYDFETYINPIDRFWFDIKNTLEANGLTPIHRLLHYQNSQRTIHHKKKKIKPRTLIKKYSKNGIGTIEIEGTVYYGLQEYIEQLDNLSLLEENEFNVFLLSPFDNSLWSREELERQYNYKYKMELYVPQKKRVYGYFVLPILYGDEFVGRVDVKMNRKESKFQFINWYWEKDFKLNDDFRFKLEKTGNELAKFHNADSVEGLPNSHS